jgi:Cof subfamily protein (haloacid dehalogenase superfamily)
MENRHHIKAIAVDLDGTLLTSESKISAITLQTLRYVIDRGIHVVVATGRSIPSAMGFIEEINTRFPAIFYNGACIHDPVSHLDLYHTTHSPEISRTIIDLSLSSTAPLQAFIDHTLYCTEVGSTASYVEPESWSIGKIIDFSMLQDPIHLTKALFIGDFSETERIRKELHQRYGELVHTVYSHEHYFEVLPTGATKGTALQRLMERYHIGPHEVLAFGDADNDREMLQWARYGYAMDNAHDSVKSIAVGTAAHHDADGVAHKIQEFLGFSLPAGIA